MTPPKVSEDETDIERLEALCRSTPKTILYYALCVLTLGFLKVVFYWFPSLERQLYYESQLKKAKFVGITEKNSNTFFIEKLKMRELKLLPYAAPRKLIFFDFKKSRYIRSQDMFEKVESFILREVRRDALNLRTFKRGLDESEVLEMRRLFGRNVIDIDLVPLFSLFVEETMTVFFFFQIFSFIVWINNDYLVYAIIIILMTVFSICMAVYQTRKQNQKIRKMAFFEEPVYVRRRDPDRAKFVIRRVSSLELQMGDLVYLSPNRKVPADVLLLSGKCVVDEALLTGESTPCLKQQASEFSTVASNHILYAGSQCLVSQSGSLEIGLSDYMMSMKESDHISVLEGRVKH